MGAKWESKCKYGDNRFMIPMTCGNASWKGRRRRRRSGHWYLKWPAMGTRRVGFVFTVAKRKKGITVSTIYPNNLRCIEPTAEWRRRQTCSGKMEQIQVKSSEELPTGRHLCFHCIKLSSQEVALLRHWNIKLPKVKPVKSAEHGKTEDDDDDSRCVVVAGILLPNF